MEKLRFAVIDQYFLLNMWEEAALLPEDEMADSLAATLGSFPDLQVICDTRDVPEATSDVYGLLEAMKPYIPIVIDHEDNIDWVQNTFGEQVRFSPVDRRTLPIDYTPLDITPFVPDHLSYHDERRNKRKEIAKKLSTNMLTKEEFHLIQDLDPGTLDIWPTYESICEHWSMSKIEIGLSQGGAPGFEEAFCRRYLSTIIESQARQSLLSQLVIKFDGQNFSANNFQSNPLFEVESKGDLILSRPAVLARKTNSLLQSELREFNRILTDTNTKEKDIQNLLESYPELFRSLGYDKVYSQVVLEREYDGKLIPDFFAQPIGEEWWDIIELKRPEPALIVGRNDRKTLSAAIHSTVSQLREYAAYFENEKYAKRIEDVYGIKCYRPNLIAIIGTDPNDFSMRETRRAMTCYSDVKVITMDKLLSIAKSRVLI